MFACHPERRARSQWRPGEESKDPYTAYPLSPGMFFDGARSRGMPCGRESQALLLGQMATLCFRGYRGPSTRRRGGLAQEDKEKNNAYGLGVEVPAPVLSLDLASDAGEGGLLLEAAGFFFLCTVFFDDCVSSTTTFLGGAAAAA